MRPRPGTARNSPFSRNNQPAFLFQWSGTFRDELDIDPPTQSGGGLFVYAAMAAGPVGRWALRRGKAEVRLDDDLRRGAFGLTADKKPGMAEKKKAGGKRGARGADAHISGALRTAYEEAVKEDVPQEFLDLLGKLN